MDSFDAVYTSGVKCPICDETNTVLVVDHDFDSLDENPIPVAQHKHCNTCHYDWDDEDLTGIVDL